MSDNCVFCDREHDIFRIDMITDDGEPYKLPVCGTCWDVIAEIATLKLEPRLIALEGQIKNLYNLINGSEV